MTHAPGNQFTPVRPPPPSPRQRRFRPRWGIAVVIAVILLMAWAVDQTEPAMTWNAWMDRMGVCVHRDRFTRLAVLGLCVTGICAVARILKETRNDDH